MFTRDLQATLVADLERHDKMLFVAGPRQTGKTTLAKMLMETRAASRYSTTRMRIFRSSPPSRAAPSRSSSVLPTNCRPPRPHPETPGARSKH
jgi:ABC-type multidrug transport system ATPase subunit